ncbi:hypothetical protein VTL71DRAFT_15711 [Oculimacula yallundae]|uniref:DNA2/NAM7 helicase helicase domain-containing protein n=1 Tax=Oculimacula yallundae TaxID=86028 RepID=A0ABR4CHI9_9HELO
MAAIADIMELADMVFCTTTIAASPEVRIFRKRVKLSAIDEAAACTELKIISVFDGEGDVALSGDDSQLPPTVMSDNAKWIDSTRRCNPMSRQGTMLMIHRLREIGFPYWEQTQQMRMAPGQFDPSNSVIYGNRLEYHPSIDLEDELFSLARKIKDWALNLKSNGMKSNDKTLITPGPDH